MRKLFRILSMSLFLPIVFSVQASALQNNNVYEYIGQPHSPEKEKPAKFINSNDEIINSGNIAPNTPDEENIKPSYKLPNEVYTKPDETIFRQNRTYITNIDPRVGQEGVNSYYPGLRGANQLIIYTPSYGLRTGTNEFGAEAVVVKNTVVKLTGADSIIPKEGFVISGHGTAKKWIQDNISLGSKIYIDTDDMAVYSFVTPETYIFEAQEKIKETSQVIEYYRMTDNCYDSRKSFSLLNKANDYIKKAQKHQDKYEHYLSLAQEAINSALNNAIPYKENEMRGVWIRPTETTEREIEKTVAELKEAGINNIFLETFYHGTTIYPSEVLAKYGVISQRGEFIGIDPLRVWLRECHNHNIKLHVWFQTFYIGNHPPRSSMKHILSVYPQWANTTKALAESEEIACSEAEHNGYFIDPANPEVQTFLTELLTEIIDKYNPDGINLDYIRYPLGAVPKTDYSKVTEWGYSKYAREDFKTLYEADPLTLKVSDPLRKKWFEYRQQKITDFVEIVRKLTNKKNIMFTTVVFTEREKSLNTKMQDWKTWSQRNLTDGFTPLLFTTDKRTAGTIIHTMQGQLSSNTKLYPGIFIMFMNAPSYDLLMQVHETRKMHTNGLILFDYAHFSDKYREALSVRAFNNKKKF